MSPKLNKFIGVMAFYVILSYFIFPLAFFYLVEKSYKSAGNGFILGSVISILLWLSYGRKMIH